MKRLIRFRYLFTISLSESLWHLGLFGSCVHFGIDIYSESNIRRCEERWHIRLFFIESDIRLAKINVITIFHFVEKFRFAFIGNGKMSKMKNARGRNGKWGTTLNINPIRMR